MPGPYGGGGRVSGCWTGTGRRRGQDPSLRCGRLEGGYGKRAGRACPAPTEWRKGERVLVEGEVGELTGHCCVCCRIRRKSPCVSSAKAVYYYYNSILGGICLLYTSSLLNGPGRIPLSVYLLQSTILQGIHLDLYTVSVAFSSSRRLS